MARRLFPLVFMAAFFMGILPMFADAEVRMYVCSPDSDYFSSLGVNQEFSVQIMAEADAPGVTMMSFRLSWTPAGSVAYVPPVSEALPKLTMTGFFPQSSADFSRLSGVVPDWTTPYAVGSSGETPEIAVFTAPPENYAGPDLLAKITFKKLAEPAPVFSVAGATAQEYLSGSQTAPVQVQSYPSAIRIDLANAKVSGDMFARATGVMVGIGANDYQAAVAGNQWSLSIKSVSPSLNSLPITVKSMEGGSTLTTVTITGLIRSPGWFVSNQNKSDHPGDGNGNGTADIFDLLILGKSYSSSAGEQKYDFRADYNADGSVGLVDLLILGQHYNQ